MDERTAPAPDVTRTRLRVGALCVSLVVSLAFASSASAAIVDVTLSNFAFAPTTVTVTAGDSVRWMNDMGNHNVKFADPEPPLLAISPPGMPWPVSRQFNAPGTFRYVCVPHEAAGMIGTVTVLNAPDDGDSGGGVGGGTPGGDPGEGGGDDVKTDLGRLQLKLSDATPPNGTRVRFFGSVRPAIDGRVLIQRRGRNGKYKTVTRVALKDGKFSKRLRAKAGVYRAVIGETADHDDATSKPKRIR